MCVHMCVYSEPGVGYKVLVLCVCSRAERRHRVPALTYLFVGS